MIRGHACLSLLVDFEQLSFVPVIRDLKDRWSHRLLGVEDDVRPIDRRSDVLTARFIGSCHRHWMLLLFGSFVFHNADLVVKDNSWQMPRVGDDTFGDASRPS